MEQFVNLIPTLGFPIVACVALGVFLYKIWNEQAKQYQANMDSMRDEYQRRETKIMEQLGNFAEALRGIDKTLSKLESRLASLEKDKE